MESKSLSKLYTTAFVKNWNNTVFSDFDGGDFTFAEVATMIKSLHLYYQVSGIRKGDKVAVLGRNSARWGTIFLSAVTSGAVIVPVLPDFNLKDTNHILNHSESRILFVSKTLVDKVDMDKSEHLETIVLLEDFTIYKSKDESAAYKLQDAFDYYKKNPLKPAELNFFEWEREDCCVISYTSGTSGFTKGVMIPERSLVSNIVYAQEHMPLEAGHRIVSFLPMAHVYGLLFEFLFPVTLGCHISFLAKMPTPQIITQAFGKVKPNLILSVPLIIEKIYKKRILPTIERPVMKVLLATPIISGVILKKVRAKLVETFGGNFFEIVIGGAPLSADVEKFFKRIKFPFTIGYGMTECGPLISYEAWNKTMTSSAGRLVDRMEVRIESEDPYNVVGEIQVRGENVMLGYYKNEQATKESFTEDGWLKTGDLGIIDANNFIYIRGRSKNMILGPSGQNIYPEEIEAKLANLPYVAECVVVDRNHKLVALVFPDKEALKADQVDEAQIPAIMAENLKKLNHELPKYESVSEIRLVDEEFEKTPKKNIKRFKYM
ncbi:MAG: AMP-binding protein [Bacteroidota bacterium]